MKNRISVVIVHQAGKELKFEAPEGYTVELQQTKERTVEIFASKPFSGNARESVTLGLVIGDAVFMKGWEPQQLDAYDRAVEEAERAQ